jgi:hypothetical protein
MKTRTLEEVRAANADMLYSLLFPERVPVAAVVGCVCLDYLTCTECERILGYSFVPIELAARKRLRTDPPVPVAHVNAGSDAAFSGMALEPGWLSLGSRSHPQFSGMALELGWLSLGSRSHPQSDRVVLNRLD